jgi:DNA-binding GntR family transcriptional regulator
MTATPQAAATFAGTGSGRKQPRRSGGSLSGDAYELLKWKILCMELEQGRLYAERELCDISGLGRAPVSHAVLRLREDRLIDVIPRRGIIVRSWSPEMIDQLMEARIPVEIEAAGLAAARASDADIAGLEALLAAGARQVEVADRAALARTDRDFHVGLARVTRNEVLVEIVEHLHERSLMLWFVNLAGRPQFQSAYDQHCDVMAALKRRDPAAARAAMRTHLQSLRRNLPESRDTRRREAA